MTVLDTFSLAERKAVVTGGNRGIGKSVARGLAEAGARVVIIGRSPEANRATIEEFTAAGLDAQAIDGDIVQSGDVADMMQQASELMGGLDILVNNAGTCIHKAALEVTDDDWDSVFDLNVKALWRCSQEAARLMAATGGGSIINIGSMSGYIVNRPQWQVAYNSSKAAVHHMTKSLAAEWAPLGIRVNALAPGYVKTEMSPVDDPKFRPHWIEAAAQQRYALPEEMAPAVVFMAAEASAFMTGSVLIMDGGYTIW